VFGKERSQVKPKKNILAQVIISTVMILIILTMIIPILNIFAKSFSDPALSPSMSGLRIIPAGFDLINYQIIFSHPVLIPSIFNSLLITIAGTCLNIFMTTSAAYVLVRPNLIGKKAIMVFLICMMLFDPGFVPEYLVVKDLGLMNSRWSVILVTAVNVFYLVIMMRFFGEVPNEMHEAATIDGAGHFRIFWQIYMPLAKSGIATLTMYYAVSRWNEYFRSGIYLLDSKKTTLQVILRQFVVMNSTETIVRAQDLLDYNEFAKIDVNALKAATIVVAIVPIIIFYPIILRYIKGGVMTGAVKG